MSLRSPPTPKKEPERYFPLLLRTNSYQVQIWGRKGWHFHYTVSVHFIKWQTLFHLIPPNFNRFFFLAKQLGTWKPSSFPFIPLLTHHFFHSLTPISSKFQRAKNNTIQTTILLSPFSALDKRHWSKTKYDYDSSPCTQAHWPLISQQPFHSVTSIAEVDPSLSLPLTLLYRNPRCFKKSILYQATAAQSSHIVGQSGGTEIMQEQDWGWICRKDTWKAD